MYWHSFENPYASKHHHRAFTSGRVLKWEITDCSPLADSHKGSHTAVGIILVFFNDNHSFTKNRQQL